MLPSSAGCEPIHRYLKPLTYSILTASFRMVPTLSRLQQVACGYLSGLSYPCVQRLQQFCTVIMRYQYRHHYIRDMLRRMYVHCKTLSIMDTLHYYVNHERSPDLIDAVPLIRRASRGNSRLSSPLPHNIFLAHGRHGASILNSFLV